MLHYVSSNFLFMLKARNVLSTVYVLYAGTALLMWHSLTVRKEKILDALRELFGYRRYYNVENNASTHGKALIIVTQFVMLVSYEALVYFFTTDLNLYVKVWLFNAELPKGIWEEITFIIIIVFRYISTAFPVFVTSLISVIFYKFQEVIQIYNKILQFQLRDLNTVEIIITFENYFKIQKTVIRLHEALSFPTFLIISHSVIRIFIATLLVVKYSKILSYGNFIDACFECMVGILILLPYTICSSMITEKLFGIKITVRNQLNELALKQTQSFPSAVLECLIRIEKHEISKLSAWGLFELSRGFILTVAGAHLAYGLLIITLI